MNDVAYGLASEEEKTESKPHTGSQSVTCKSALPCAPISCSKVLRTGATAAATAGRFFYFTNAEGMPTRIKTRRVPPTATNAKAATSRIEASEPPSPSPSSDCQ